MDLAVLEKVEVGLYSSALDEPGAFVDEFHKPETAEPVTTPTWHRKQPGVVSVRGVRRQVVFSLRVKPKTTTIMGAVPRERKDNA